MTEEKAPRKTGIVKKIGRILLSIVLIVILLVVTILILIQTPPVQNFLVKKATAYLENKLKTRVEIGRLYVGFPKDIVLENIYLEDRKKDTLLAGGELRVDISMMKLLHKEVEINDIKLNRITAKVTRVLPDTTFNFQFIIDAFASKPTPQAKTDTGSLNMNIKYVQLDKIRLVYKDAVTGNDIEVGLQHFETNIDKFDLARQRFDIPVTKINGLTGKVYQSKPLVTSESPAKDIQDAKQPAAMQLNMKKLLVNDVALDYRNDVSATYASLNLGALTLNVNKLDLQNQVIDLNELLLNKTTAAIRLGKAAGARVVAKEAGQEVDAQSQAGWRVLVNAIRFDDNNLQFDDDNKPRQQTGIDYAHLKADNLTLHLDNLLYSKDSIAGKITSGSFSEQSGFRLNRWQTDFLYANREAYLKNLLLQTPGTELSRSVVLHYPSIDALKTNIGALQMDVDIQNSKVQVKDILTFVPSLRSQPAFSNPSSTLRMNGRLKGSVARLEIDALQMQAFNDTRVNVHGTILGLPDIKKAGGNLVITDLSTSRSDIVMLAPKGSLPSSIALPEHLKLTGRIAGGINNVHPDLLLNTTFGAVSIKGSLQQASDPRKARYNALVQTTNLNLGALLRKPQEVGTLSAKFTAIGTGYDMKTADARINGIVQSAVVKKYNYRNLRLDASIAHQQMKATASIHDPNIDVSFDASGNLAGKYPAIKLVASIDSIKTMPLHFTADQLIYRGKINGDFPVTDPDHLNGSLLVTQSILVTDSQRINLDTLELAAGNSDSGQYIRLTADAINMQLHGQYRLTQLGSVFQQAIQPYFAILPPAAVVKVDPYNFSFSGSIVNKPLLTTFVPALQRLDPVNFSGRFSSDNGWVMNLGAPLVVYGTNRIENLQLQAGLVQNAIAVKATVQHVTSGSSIALYGTALNVSIANNLIDFALSIKDKANKDKYSVAAVFAQPRPNDYTFAIKPQNLLLNYDPWTVTGDNLIAIMPDGVNARNFVLSKGNQQLTINSLSPEANAPMQVNFNNFQLATLANFVQSDSLLVEGTLNGKVLLNNLLKQPTFTSDLAINELSVKKDTIGNINLQVNNTIANTFAADVKVSGHGNDVQLTGNYYLKPDSNSSFDMSLDIRQILLHSIEGATLGAISNASGALTGKFAINGTVSKPNVDGNLNFNKAAFNLSMLNSYYRLDNEHINVTNEGISFNKFTIKDSANNTAVLDGMAYNNGGFTDYRFDLSLKANNFRALNTTKKDNKVYYGQLFFNSNLRIKGTQLKPVVDGSLAINEQTKLTVVLPQKEPGLEARKGIVEFVDMDAVPNDSLFMAKYDSINKTDVLGLDVSLNITIDKLAEFSVIVDEGNGDFLRVRGGAQLSGGVDPSGKITLAGSYELEEGAYELSFNFLHRKFNIQKGSTIVWTGEPTKANVDITAIYVAKTAPLDLVGDQVEESLKNFLRQKLPFQVDLKMKGELLKPELTFDIVLPDDQNYNIDKNVISAVETKLDNIRQEPSELNKQVFALLLLGRFITENPFASSAGGMTAESVARNSVSQLLSEQLNNLASNLIKGVDINFDLASTTDDYTTGEQRSRTDLNVALSKRLLNDRLTVTIGSNFALEGAQSSAKQRTNNLAGNVNVDYKLSKDGKYALRAYRKNDYEGVVEGYVIETGVGFVISVDYNQFKQIFQSKKQREQLRAMRKQEREKEENEKKKAEADDPNKAIKPTNGNSNE